MKVSFADGLRIRTEKLLIETIEVSGTDVDDRERQLLADYKKLLEANRPLNTSQSRALRDIHMRRVKSREPE